MDAERRLLLRRTFEKLVPLPKRFGQAFYRRLFELDPNLRLLFRGDLDRQASMLAEALALGVLQLVDEQKVSGHIRALGARHARYGVVERHYELFGRALLDALAERLGDDFTPEIGAAWNEAWHLLSAAMLEASREESARLGRAREEAAG
jgi:hemoglobin-like flavoprotein